MESGNVKTEKTQRWDERVILDQNIGGVHGPQDSGSSSCNNTHVDNNDDDNNSCSWHYRGSYRATGNRSNTFPAFAPLLSLTTLSTIFDPYFTDGETKARLETLSVNKWEGDWGACICSSWWEASSGISEIMASDKLHRVKTDLFTVNALTNYFPTSHSCNIPVAQGFSTSTLLTLCNT